MLKEEAFNPCTATYSVFPPLVWDKRWEGSLTGANDPAGSRALLEWLPMSQEKRASDFAGATGCRFPGLMLPEEKDLHW